MLSAADFDDGDDECDDGGCDDDERIDWSRLDRNTRLWQDDVAHRVQNVDPSAHARDDGDAGGGDSADEGEVMFWHDDEEVVDELSRVLGLVEEAGLAEEQELHVVGEEPEEDFVDGGEEEGDEHLDLDLEPEPEEDFVFVDGGDGEDQEILDLVQSGNFERDPLLIEVSKISWLANNAIVYYDGHGGEVVTLGRCRPMTVHTFEIKCQCHNKKADKHHP